MAVKLRLTRLGKKKQPFYRIVAVDSRTRRDGKYIEKVGHYNPLPDPAEVLLDEEKVIQWLKKGATPSDTVKNLLTKKGILLKWDLIKRGCDKAKVEEEFKKWELLQLENQKKIEALKAQTEREVKKEDKTAEVEKEDSKVEEQSETEKKES